ncbi:MAG: response regulator [Desulfatiglans sp.]|jgi:response regulator RpfG family c-di-GMP phosphodiesterase|nr:response regulator [Thermodesulfobacteriota bacterium]MEE4352113.1 response regulator [Desulfatiglans sp.]
MNEGKHTILFVDDEENVSRALKRLLRKERYRLLSATGGKAGLEILRNNDVHLVICDQRMPEMSGTEFLAQVREEFPDVIRIILTGYTEVDAITESINRGHIYKFFLKPWNDQNLKLEIKQALAQYDLVQANRSLHDKILVQNQELKKLNENLEDMVKERTIDLEMQNEAMELSHSILESLPIPIIGIGSEKMVVLINEETKSLTNGGKEIELGKNLSDYFSDDILSRVEDVFESGCVQRIEEYLLKGVVYEVIFLPLAGKFNGRGIIIVFSNI